VCDAAVARLVRTVGLVLESWILRIEPRRSTRGELAGHLERVATGELASFNSAEQLIAICRAAMRAGGDERPSTASKEQPTA
jgi:hypothetical protein